MKKVHVYAAILLGAFIAASILIPYFALIILGLVFLQWIYDATVSVEITRPSDDLPINYRDNLSPSEQLTLYRHNKYLYLKSTAWQDKRKQVLARDNYHCVDCGADHNLQVHHLCYTNLGKEPLADLVTLCGNCHTKRHETVGYPQTYEDYTTFNDKS